MTARMVGAGVVEGVVATGVVEENVVRAGIWWGRMWWGQVGAGVVGAGERYTIVTHRNSNSSLRYITIVIRPIEGTR